uniref:Uncharacterized protein n=2 Tax=Oryza sativa subsp. japonica TaxID=39947 RepID=Q10IJ4_ORYSJ|nr:hypothetical protein [Oryza sativa Japonica Group]AAO73246.1 hypothetical protein [Oryza sativa Japonica Group]ABF96995.1 hypothetical protein LOC_Os03g34054 [Oryza sativa Japonica Group]
MAKAEGSRWYLARPNASWAKSYVPMQ